MSANVGDLTAEDMGGPPLVEAGGGGAGGGQAVPLRAGLRKERGGRCTSRAPVAQPLPLHPCHCH